MIKQPGLKFSGLHISILLCDCWTYDDNIGPKIKDKYSTAFHFRESIYRIVNSHIRCYKATIHKSCIKRLKSQDLYECNKTKLRYKKWLQLRCLDLALCMFLLVVVGTKNFLLEEGSYFLPSKAETKWTNDNPNENWLRWSHITDKKTKLY